MGAWSGEPFGNDVAADWAWELEEADDWTVVRAALAEATAPDAAIDERTAEIGVAAAEVVAHGLGRPTQDDAYTGEVTIFAARAASPSPAVVALALQAIDRAADPEGELGRMWTGCGDEAWREALERLTAALHG